MFDSSRWLSIVVLLLGGCGSNGSAAPAVPASGGVAGTAGATGASGGTGGTGSPGGTGAGGQSGASGAGGSGATGGAAAGASAGGTSAAGNNAAGTSAGGTVAGGGTAGGAAGAGAGGGGSGGAPSTCNPMKQDCPAGDASKCALSFSMTTDGSPTTACVTGGTKVEGQACFRPTGVAGVDDCAPGFYCTADGLPGGTPQMRACAPLCDAMTTCGTGKVCSVFGPPVATNVVGVCVKACNPSNQASCGTNQTCTPNLWRPDGTQVVGGVCTAAGNAAVGQDCSNAICVAGAACFGGGSVPGIACAKLCDAAKDCAAGEACTLYSNDPSNPYGLCLAQCDPAMPKCPANRTCQTTPTVTGSTVHFCF